jgi:hypothetical protein
MAAPTFVADYDAAWNSFTSPKTASVTTAVDDVLVICRAAESEVSTFSLPTGGTGTYANQEDLGPTDYTRVRIDTVSAGVTAQTYTLSCACSAAGLWWGAATARFSGSTGIGAAESTTGASGGPSLDITTTQDNSALVVIVGDWAAVDGTTRTWRTVNGTTPTAGNGLELNYFRSAAHYTTYLAYYPDAGAAGLKTVGLSAPTGQKFTIAAVEVKGTASAQGPPRPPVLAPSRAAIQASTW